MSKKVIRRAYLCDGRPDCYGQPSCKLAHIFGSCEHTTDISYARNRKKIMHDIDYPQRHMIKKADSEYEEAYFEV